jgi:hypothetical protein
VANLPGLDELGHRADRLLDFGLLVDPVLVVEVDVVDAQALERRLARLPDVLRAPFSPRTLPNFVASWTS